ncbi:MAG: MFS transporter [Parvularculaceae bacterium]
MAQLDQTDTVRSAAARVWALLLGVGLLLAGNGLQGTLIGLVAEDAGFSSAVTGLVMTAYFAGFLIGSHASETFISRDGHVRTFAALASLSSVAILIHGLFVDPVVWTAMRFATGFSFAGLYVVTESWLNRETTRENRGGLLAVYMVVSHTGLASGQVLLNAAPASSLAIYVLASALLSVAVLPILLSSAPQPHVSPDGARLSFSALFRTTPLGATGCFLAGIANGILLGMAAVYARQSGFGVGAISVFMAAIMIGGAAFQWPIGKLSDRIDRRFVILGVAAAAALAAARLEASTGDAALFAVVGFVVGGLTLTLYPLFLSYANDWFEPDQMVSASSGLVTIYGAGAMLGPLGGGLLMGVLGPQGFALYLSVLLIVVAGFTAYRIMATDGPTSQDDFLYAPAAVGVSDYWAEAAAEIADEAGDETSARAGVESSAGANAGVSVGASLEATVEEAPAGEARMDGLAPEGGPETAAG